MADKKTSQTQQETTTAATDALSQGLATWAKITQDSIERVTALADELASVEARTYARAKDAMNEADKLGREWVDYVSSLSAEWRRLAITSTRNAADLFSGRA